MLTVLTWLWAQPGGRTTYRPEHVNAWAAMVRRNLRLPHRVVCVTDMPAGIAPDVEIIDPPDDFTAVRLATWGPSRPQCLRRLSMFRRDAADIFGDRFVSMDMDCVITGSLDPLFDRPEDIVLYAAPPGSKPATRRFNGSMLMMTAGARPHVFDQFDPTAAARASAELFGSDQAWISASLDGSESTWSEADGVYWAGRWENDIAARCRVVFFQGEAKPWDVIPEHKLGRIYREAARMSA
jgi:hypothetical protein